MTFVRTDEPEMVYQQQVKNPSHKSDVLRFVFLFFVLASLLMFYLRCFTGSVSADFSALCPNPSPSVVFVCVCACVCVCVCVRERERERERV